MVRSELYYQYFHLGQFVCFAYTSRSRVVTCQDCAKRCSFHTDVCCSVSVFANFVSTLQKKLKKKKTKYLFSDLGPFLSLDRLTRFS